MQKRIPLATCLFALVLLLGTRASAADSVDDTLKRQTQELLDAITTGSVAVWDRYLDKDAHYVDESGAVLTKKEMLEGLKPLPEGVSCTITVKDFDVALHGNVAVATICRRRERGLPRPQAPLPVPNDGGLDEGGGRVACHRGADPGAA